MKVVIVMTYYNRPFQLSRTLETLKHSAHKDFEVVIVDDFSEEPINHHITEFPIHIIRITDKKWKNPEPAYNTGLRKALELNPDIVIIQNAECYHVGDVISDSLRVTDGTYFAYSCFSLDAEHTFIDHDIQQLIKEHPHKVVISGEIGWYNHPIYRPNAFDFCSAITVRNLKLLNGFDERYSDGYAIGDVDLIDRIKRKLKLSVQIPLEPFVVHQWHYAVDLPAEYIRLFAVNKVLFQKIKKESNYRAKHIYTPDLS